MNDIIKIESILAMVDQNRKNVLLEATRQYEIIKLANRRMQLYIQECSFIYIFYSQKTKAYKVGVTKNIDRRKKEISSKVKETVCEIEVFQVPKASAFSIENAVHGALEKYKHSGEWYKCNDKSEIYRIVNETIEEYFSDHCEIFDINYGLWALGKSLGMPVHTREILEINDKIEYVKGFFKAFNNCSITDSNGERRLEVYDI